jgi:hypothetical protein
MNKRLLPVLSLLCVIYLPGISFSEDPLVEYLAGVSLLRTVRDMPDSVKAAYYVKLCGVTGIDNREADEKLKALMDNPDGWAKLNARMLTVLDSLAGQKSKVGKVN